MSNDEKYFGNKTTFNFGEVSEKDIVDFHFDFLGGPDEVQWTWGACTCTDSWFTGKQIVGKLTIPKVQKFTERKTLVEKYVYVDINDGHHNFIRGNGFRRIANPKKAQIRLLLTGFVIKE